jgi:hypothetical protein
MAGCQRWEHLVGAKAGVEWDYPEGNQSGMKLQVWFDSLKVQTIKLHFIMCVLDSV